MQARTRACKAARVHARLLAGIGLMAMLTWMKGLMAMANVAKRGEKMNNMLYTKVTPTLDL